MPVTPVIRVAPTGDPLLDAATAVMQTVQDALDDIATLVNAIETSVGLKLAGDAAQAIAGASASALLRLKQTGTGPGLSIANSADVDTVNLNPDGSVEIGDMPSGGKFEDGFQLRLVGGIAALRAALLAALGNDASGFDLRFYKSRTTDPDARDSVALNDLLGRLLWSADAGASTEDAAAVTAEVDGAILEAVTIATITRAANVVTVVTTGAHSILAGESFSVEDVTKTAFNGVFTAATVPNSTTITYAQVATNDSDTTGSVAKRNMPSRLVFYGRRAGQTAIEEMARIGSDRNLALKAGIKFPATPVLSSDPNTLDAYEEGDWTPVVKGSTTAGTGTYSTQAGKYVRNGRMVIANCSLSWSAHTGTGDLTVDGLPYSSLLSQVAVTVRLANLTFTGAYVQAIQTGTLINIQTVNAAGTIVNVAMDASAVLHLTASYII